MSEQFRDTEPKQDPRAALMERFKNNPDELAHLQVLRKEAEARWAEEGYGEVAVYVDAEGNPVLLSRKLTLEDEPSDEMDDKVYRLALDQAIYDVSVPPEMQGDLMGNTSFRGSGSSHTIYDLLPEVDDLDFEPGEMLAEPLRPTPELEPLQQKFGNYLRIEVSSMGEGAHVTLDGENFTGYDIKEFEGGDLPAEGESVAEEPQVAPLIDETAVQPQLRRRGLFRRR